MNRLGAAHSPYLRQHAHNPVHWWPWCDEAFAEARRRDLPVFLSIGYAACHWCHVMERESFEDPAVAAFLNERFVSIKVDREERPDVDAVYLEALHVQGRAGGWPASLWLDPERRPFYSGTYFPPRGAYGRPGFLELLRALDQTWRQDRERVQQQATQVVALLRQANAAPTPGALPPSPAAACAAQLAQAWDEEQGGWGQGQRFPIPARLELLLGWGLLDGAQAPLDLVRQALDVMDRGGLNDHLAGGFHRYCVDPGWEVPHFEKMLYDNGQLLRLYARAASALGVERWAQVARDTATWLLRELQDPDGGFWASLDADSEGHEGTFYVWTPEELELALGPEPARLLAAAYGVRPGGNFEGRSVLNRGDVDPEHPPLRAARAALLRARARRPRPTTDTKLVSAWNGLAIGGLACAGRLLNEPSFIYAAARAADRWLLAIGPDGALPRTLAPGAPAGVLEDYAFLAEGLLDLYEADPDPRWLLGAEQLAAALLARFGDGGGPLFRAEAGAADLVVRPLETTDGAEPSGYGRALEVLLRLEALGSPVAERARLEAALACAPPLRERPALCPSLCWVAERLARPGRELVIAVPAPEHPALPGLLAAWNRRWRPDVVLGLSCPAWESGLSHLTALRGKRPAPDGPRVFVCVDRACGLPVRTPEALLRELDGA